jgi:hypothetical protein
MGQPEFTGEAFELLPQYTLTKHHHSYHGYTLYMASSKSFGTFETVRQLNVLAMSGKLCCLVACFLIIILFAQSSCY